MSPPTASHQCVLTRVHAERRSTSRSAFRSMSLVLMTGANSLSCRANPSCGPLPLCTEPVREPRPRREAEVVPRAADIRLRALHVAARSGEDVELELHPGDLLGERDRVAHRRLV